MIFIFHIKQFAKLLLFEEIHKYFGKKNRTTHQKCGLSYLYLEFLRYPFVIPSLSLRSGNGVVTV